MTTDEKIIKNKLGLLRLAEELATSMEDLGIDLQDDAGSQTPAAQPNYLDELERLGALRDQGIITEDEFQTKKQQLLGL
jgi:hypothetical protein